MKRLALIPLILVVVLALVAMGGGAATSELTPAQQITQLKKQVRALRLDNADLQDEVDALNAVNGDQADTIQRLRTRLANQPDPLDAIMARGPDGQWAAIVALYGAFQTRLEGELCGNIKDNDPGSGVGLTLTTYTFGRFTGC